MQQQHYFVINAFFDCYGLSQARSLLSRMIKAADSEKTWKGRSPSDLLFFTGKMEELMEAVFSLVGGYDYRPEVILDKDNSEDIWSLANYDSYCGWHIHSSPWDFFPRHLTQKEFLDPYRALEKFTGYRSLDKWKKVLSDLLFHALSPHSIYEFDDGAGILRTWLQLHKLLEAAHLVELRSNDEKKQHLRLKWKDKKGLEKQSGNQKQEIYPPKL